MTNYRGTSLLHSEGKDQIFVRISKLQIPRQDSRSGIPLIRAKTFPIDQTSTKINGPQIKISSDVQSDKENTKFPVRVLDHESSAASEFPVRVLDHESSAASEFPVRVLDHESSAASEFPVRVLDHESSAASEFPARVLDQLRLIHLTRQGAFSRFFTKSSSSESFLPKMSRPSDNVVHYSVMASLLAPHALTASSTPGTYENIDLATGIQGHTCTLRRVPARRNRPVVSDPLWEIRLLRRISRNNSSSSQFMRRKSNFDLELSKFSDLDYVLPQEVWEVLQKEGVDDSTLETWLTRRELRHQRAEALRQFKTAKAVRKPFIKRREPTLLPPIKCEERQPATNTERKDDQVLQPPTISPSRLNSTPRRPAAASPRLQTLPDIRPGREASADSDEDNALTEMEERRWRREEELERQSLPEHNYTPPRLLLISSKVSWCQSMSGAVRKEGHVKCIVYDFETWTFNDIIEACRKQLDDYRKDCKAQSLMLICKGGCGYLYLLQNYVLTPQKLSKSLYKDMKAFWYSIGDLISKRTPEEACVHVLGGDLESSTQGRMLNKAILQVIRPNRIKLESPSENSIQGRAKIELYFDYRKFLLWRSQAVSEFDLLDPLDCARSWSSIAEEVQR